MKTDALAKELIDGTVDRCLHRGCQRIALIGATDAAVTVRAGLSIRGFDAMVLGIFDPGSSAAQFPGLRSWDDFLGGEPDLLVICSDTEKESLLRACAAAVGAPASFPEVVLGGTAHLEYRNPVYAELDRPALVPSYATGHPYTRIHLFQCLEAAAQANLTGAVIELGAFKGGTTAWLAQTVKRLGLGSRVLAFDSWAGFPQRRSLLDLYTHPRCVFEDVAAVRQYLGPLGVELVVGDIAETAPVVLRDVPILLAFVDTDNYTGARRALETIHGNVVAGGAIVFDHYWTTADYLYTIGERIAGHDVLAAEGFLQLHGTGVFVKLARGQPR